MHGFIAPLQGLQQLTFCPSNADRCVIIVLIRKGLKLTGALQQVPDGEVLPIYLHGSSTAPVIDWVGCAPAL